MKKFYPIVLLTISLIFSACGGSKPDVHAVSLVEPWTSLKLPCNGNAIVIVAQENQFNCAYGGTWSVDNDVKTIMPYVDFLKENGWKITDQSKKGNSYLFEKNGKEIVIFPTAGFVNTDTGTIQWEGFGIQAEYRNKVR